MGYGLQLALGCLAEGQDLFNGVAVFALEAVDQVQPFFHLAQANGIIFNLVTVIPQALDQILQLVADLLGHSTPLRQRRINFLQAGQVPHHQTQEVNG